MSTTSPRPSASSSVAPARTIAPTPAPRSPRCATGARCSSPPTRTIRSRRAGSAPRCAPIWSMSTIPTGCNIRCAASAPKAPASGSASPGTTPLARSPPLAGDHRRVRRRGHPALLLQRHARPRPEHSLRRAPLEPHGRQRTATLDLRRGGGGGGAGDLGARWAPDPADVAAQPADPHLGTQPRQHRAALHAAAARGAAARRLRRRDRSAPHHHRALRRRAHPAAPGHRRRAGARPDARPLRRGTPRRGLAGGEHRSAGASCATAPPNIRRSVSPRSPASQRRDDHRRSRAAMGRPSQRCSSSPTACSGMAMAARRRARSACLPAMVGQIGVRGGGLFYSTSDYVRWDAEALGHASECPPTPRVVNMNRLGAALRGEVSDPPIQSLFVFCANPVTSTPNASTIIEGMLPRRPLHRRP